MSATLSNRNRSGVFSGKSVFLSLLIVSSLWIRAVHANGVEEVTLPADTISKLSIESHVYHSELGQKSLSVYAVAQVADDRVSDVTVPVLGLGAQVAGHVHGVYADIGDFVRKGQPLVRIYSPDYIDAQAAYLGAIALLKASPGDSASLSVLASATERLRNMGVSKREIDELRRSGHPHREQMIHSQINGIVLFKNVVKGQTITAGQRLFEIGNIDIIRVNGHVPQEMVHRVHLGDPLQVFLPDGKGAVSGHVVYISPVEDPVTRTVLVRGLFPNRPLRIRPGMFVTMKIGLSGNKPRFWLPRRAVYLENGRVVVFVETSAGHFRMIPVKRGNAWGGRVPVTGPFPPAPRIVDENGYWVKAQFERMKKSDN